MSKNKKGTKHYFINHLSEFKGYWEGGNVSSRKGYDAQYICHGFYTHILRFNSENDFRIEGMATTGKLLYDTGWIFGNPQDLKDLLRIFVCNYERMEDEAIEVIEQMQKFIKE